VCCMWGDSGGGVCVCGEYGMRHACVVVCVCLVICVSLCACCMWHEGLCVHGHACVWLYAWFCVSVCM